MPRRSRIIGLMCAVIAATGPVSAGAALPSNGWGGLPSTALAAPLSPAMLGYVALIVVVGLCVSLLLWLWVDRQLPTLPLAHRLVLKDEAPTPAEAARQAAAVWPLPGMVGRAVTDLRPGGTAKFAIDDRDPDDTANADVISDRGFVPAGALLAVVAVEGSRVVVRPTSERSRAEVG